MKKLLLLLLFPSVCFAANTFEYRDNSIEVTSSQINTHTAPNGTTAIEIGQDQAAAVQCVWASVTGIQPVFKLQTSNDNSNWDDVSGASTTTTGASGSSTFRSDHLVAKYGRVYVSTTSTAGTLDCITILGR